VYIRYRSIIDAMINRADIEKRKLATELSNTELEEEKSTVLNTPIRAMSRMTCNPVHISRNNVLSSEIYVIFVFDVSTSNGI